MRLLAGFGAGVGDGDRMKAGRLGQRVQMKSQMIGQAGGRSSGTGCRKKEKGR